MMKINHRSQAFVHMTEEAISILRSLLKILLNYKIFILFQWST
ncbi:hypothetical protein [Candidatus Erwinia haradaeae]|nr:hypothetical protein [Candidatus Erwinia haradaeae]